MGREVTHLNRESWLVALVEALRPTFAGHGAPLPDKLRVSCSFPSRGGIKQAGKTTTIGQCWYPSNSVDGTTEVFVSPTIADPVQVAEILVHELVHAALGPGHGHGKVFKRLALLVGLEGKMTATSAGSRLLIAVSRTLASSTFGRNLLKVPEGIDFAMNRIALRQWRLVGTRPAARSCSRI